MYINICKVYLPIKRKGYDEPPVSNDNKLSPDFAASSGYTY